MSWIVALAIVGSILQLVFIAADLGGHPIAAAILKTLAALLFVAIGAVGAKAQANATFAWVVVGLALGAGGDLLHALRFIPAVKRRLPHLFAAGALVFLAGHISYLVALVGRTSKPAVVVCCAALVWLVSALILSKQVHIPQHSLRVVCASYYFVLICMLSFAIAHALQSPAPSAWLFAGGAVWFVVSDVVLAKNTFCARRRASLRILSLTTYYAAQLMIAFSLSFT